MLSIEHNQMMIEHFEKVLYISNDQILIQMKDTRLCVKGSALHVAALGKHEILIEGTWKELVFDYDQK